jgi:hypothetical protein
MGTTAAEAAETRPASVDGFDEVVELRLLKAKTGTSVVRVPVAGEGSTVVGP